MNINNFTEISIDFDKMVYLDHNIIGDCLNNEDLKKIITDLKKDFIFPYSSAHLEEISNIKISDKSEQKNKINQHIAFISSLSDSIALRPLYSDKDIYILREDPIKCWKRILSYEHTKDDDDAFFKSIYTPEINRQLQEELGIVTKIIANIPPKEIFDHEPFKSHAKLILYEYLHGEEYAWSVLKKNHSKLEGLISILYARLGTLGYASERGNNAYRSRIHDVTHAIYATKTKILVSSDARFIKKCTAVYKFLNIPTIVMHLEDFLDQNK